MTPLVSVCIGAYNRERYIRETLDSVFAQTYPNLEVIVVDDASTDRTVEIVQSYGDRVKLIRRTRNSGLPAVPRNEAIRASSGYLIAFLDADDLWSPAKLETQVAWMAQHPEVVMSHGYCHVIDSGSRIVGIRHEGRLALHMSFEDLLQHCYITISSVVIQRQELDDIGLFNEDVLYRAREDYELFLRVARRHEVNLIPGCILGAYRVCSSSLSHGDKAWKSQPEDMLMHQSVLRRPELWLGVVSRHVVVSAFVENALQNAQFWRDHGYPGRSLFFALAVLCESPFNGAAWSHVARSLVRSVLRRGHTAGVMERT